MRKVLVVLSGGQDSTTCLFWVRNKLIENSGPKDQFELHAVTFDYGQRHLIELRAAMHIAEKAGCKSHEVIAVPNCLKSTSPLTSKNELERYESFKQMDKVIGERVELTFVPMRNTLFLAIAANRAVAMGCYDIVTGVCQQDNANYPDCTVQFIANMQTAINSSLGIRNFRIHTPLIHLTKAQSVIMASELPGCMDALAYSHTSYDGKYPPTDMNHANILRAQGFLEANMPDPLVVRAWKEGLMPLPETENYTSTREAESVEVAKRLRL